MNNGKKSGFKISAALVIGLAGYGTSAAQPRPQAEPPAAQGQTTMECPNVMRGVTIATEDVKNGVALTLITPKPDQLVELRKQIRQAADVIEKQSKLTASQPMTQDDGAHLPPVDITVNEVKSGARVLVRADQQQDVASVREMAKGFEQVWESSECAKTEPTIGMQGQGGMSPQQDDPRAPTPPPPAPMTK